MLYFQSVKSKLQHEYPDMKHAELVKKISQEWAKTDPPTKQQFQKQHEEQQAIYKQKIVEYNNSITEDQKLLIIEELTKKKETLEKDQVKQVYIYINISIKAIKTKLYEFNIYDLFL